MHPIFSPLLKGEVGELTASLGAVLDHAIMKVVAFFPFKIIFKKGKRAAANRLAQDRLADITATTSGQRGGIFGLALGHKSLGPLLINHPDFLPIDS